MKKTKKTRKGRGKAKGGAFERMVCKQLSLWVTHGKKEDVFWRSAMSGGRATLAHAKGKDVRRQAGDVTAVAPEGHTLTDHFFCELKHYKDLAIDNFFLKQTGILATFWLKACHEAVKYQKQPLMIARQNGSPIMVITRMDALRNFVKDYDGVAGVMVTGAKFRCKVMLYDELLLKYRFKPHEAISHRRPAPER